MAKYVSEERLSAILQNHVLTSKTQSFIQYLIDNECQELNPWMTLAEFLKSGFEGLCWVEYHNGKVTSLNYFNGRFLSTDTGHQVISNIIKVQPIHKPEPPR